MPWMTTGAPPGGTGFQLAGSFWVSLRGLDQIEWRNDDGLVIIAGMWGLYEYSMNRGKAVLVSNS
jgi:hypothetical protein